MKDKLATLLKLLKKNKKVIIGIGIFLFLLIFLISFYIITHKVTNLEKVKITDFNKNISSYLDEIIEHDEDDGKYLNFAVEYLYDKKTRKSIKQKN